MKKKAGADYIPFTELYKSGIYMIKNKMNGKCYIGQSRFIFNRWCNHIQDLISGRHSNNELQEDFIRYGLESFEVKVLDECKEVDLNFLEQYYIKNLSGNFYLYNVNN